jgi:predicted phage terminase large subunit-like protein
VMAVTPLLQARQVYLPKGIGWADDLRHEAAAFPLGAHDDMVDAWSQALARLDGSRVSSVATPGRARRNR